LGGCHPIVELWTLRHCKHIVCLVVDEYKEFVV